MKRILKIHTAILMISIIAFAVNLSQAYVLYDYNWAWMGGSPTINMKINPNCSDPSASYQLEALKANLATWSAGWTGFRFNYGGSTSIIINTFNGQNEICWNPGSGGSGVLATCFNWIYTSNPNNIVESDIVFWDQDYTWSSSWPAPTEKDIQTIGVHELGHTVGLNHSQYNWAVMWPYIYGSEIHRELSQDDIDGFSAIYGATSTPSLIVTINPTGSVNVPSSGGSIPYTASFKNNTAGTVAFAGWIDYENSQGQSQGLLALRPNLSLSSSATLTRSLSLNVAATVQPGMYYFYARSASAYPGPVISQDYFMFFKAAGDDGGPRVAKTDVSGWDDPAESTLQTPHAFQIVDAFPNPFNPETTLRFDLLKTSSISLAIYNLQGAKIVDLLSGTLDAGHYGVTWDAASYPSGTYIYCLSSEMGQTNGKLVLMK